MFLRYSHLEDYIEKTKYGEIKQMPAKFYLLSNNTFLQQYDSISSGVPADCVIKQRKSVDRKDFKL